MKSWKTTAAAAVSALAGLATIISLIQQAPPWLTLIGAIASAVAKFLHGLAGRDNNRTSADVGATTKTAEGRRSEAVVAVQAAQTIEAAPVSVAIAVAEKEPTAAPLPGPVPS